MTEEERYEIERIIDQRIEKRFERASAAFKEVMSLNPSSKFLGHSYEFMLRCILNDVAESLASPMRDLSSDEIPLQNNFMGTFSVDDRQDGLVRPAGVTGKNTWDD